MTSANGSTPTPAPGIRLEPSFWRAGDDFWADWPLHSARMRFSGVHEDKGGLHAELVVYMDIPGAPVPAEWTQINLAASQTRATLANRLHEQWSGPDCPPYRDMLKEVSWWLSKQVRQSEPVQRLTRKLPISAPKYRLWPVLPEGQVASIYADGGHGKSYLLLAMLLLLQEGREGLGLRPSMKSNVLYLDYECNFDEQQLRLSRVARGLGIPNYEDIAYKECYRPLHSELPEIRRIVDEEHIDVVAVDSMALAMGGDPKEGKDAIQIMGALRALHCSVLVLDHITKDGEQGKAYGSGFKFNYSRAAWELKKAQEEDSADLYVAAIHRKANNGQKLAPLGFHIHFDNSGDGTGPVALRRFDIRDIDGLASNVSVSSRIQHALKGSPLSYNDLAERVNAAGEVKPNTLTQAFNRLRKSGAIVTVGGKYGLAHRG